MSSLYLHIPFCRSKCSYCDFFSTVCSSEQRDRYVEQLRKNISLLREVYPGYGPLSTIYLGGGTPSLLTSAQITALLNTVAETFGIDADAEISCEANPGTVAPAQLSGYRAAGINRLSLGLQSFDDNNLRMLGRSHHCAESLASVEIARKAGFDNLSLDLIFALPRQTLLNLTDELSQVLDLQPEHISIYGLTIEEGTELERQVQQGKLHPCRDELYAEQYRMIHDRLESAGYDHYEISNFAKPERRCRHNQNYWLRQPCLAAGAGAHGFDPENWGRRWSIPADIEQYNLRIDNEENPDRTLETFDREAAMREFMYLGLRTREGVSDDSFETHFGQKIEQTFSTAIRRTSPYLQHGNRRWFFNADGWLLYDHLISFFL